MWNKIVLIVLIFGLNNVFAGEMGIKNIQADFNGFYAGLGVGGINLLQKSTKNDRPNRPADLDRYSYAAASISGNLGYGKLFANKSYLGIKGSVFYTPWVNDTLQDVASRVVDDEVLFRKTYQGSFVKPIYNVDLVLGYEIAPRLLSFFEGGVSFANIKHNIDNVRSHTTFTPEPAETFNISSYNINEYKTGYNLGLGLNYLVGNNWFLFGEFVYNDLGTYSHSGTLLPPDSTNFSHSFHWQSLSVLGGISYLFNC